MRRRREYWTTVLVLLALLAGSRALAGLGEGEPVPLRLDLRGYPPILAQGRWRGVEAELDAEVIAEVDAEATLSRYYRGTDGGTVWFYVAYYGRPGVRRIHIPKNCYPAHGWKELDSGRDELPGMAPGGSPLAVRRFLFGRGAERRLVLYAIAHAQGSTADEYRLRFRQTLGALWGGPLGPLVTVQVSAAVPVGADEAQVERSLRAFLAEALPVLYPHLPFGPPSTEMAAASPGR